MSRNKARAVVWLDPADENERRIIESIKAKPPKERHPYVLSLLLRGYALDGELIYRETLRALKDYQPQFNTEKQEEVENIPSNMLDFLFSLQKDGEE